ncbi:MAG TPA: hypothetical protein VGI85_05075 [Chthoniobacterales bacterium]|jgi:type II secretory pathway pseudopilin PulG
MSFEKALKTSCRRAVGAFTIAELLVAIALTLVIVAILFRVFAATARQWQTSDQRIDTFRDARAVLQLMARELGRADISGNPEMIALFNQQGNYASEAYTVAPIPNSGKSDLCAVGYYTEFDSTTKAFSLKRVFKDSDAAFPALAGAAPNFTSLYAKTPNDETVAAYVWDLEFRPGLLADPVAPTANPTANWKWLEIRFKSMSPAAARKIRNFGVTANTWSDPTSALYKNLILPYEQQFVTRVVLRQNQ